MSGILTTDLGELESNRMGFVQDGTGGIAIRLDAALVTTIPAGTAIEVSGTLGTYFSLRTLNATAATLVVAGPIALPSPLAITTGLAVENVEGARLRVTGTVTAAPSSLSDGLGVTIDDGSGPLRLVVAVEALGSFVVSTGDTVTATGPLGQRDSGGTGLAGYRLHVTQFGEFVVAAPPTPSPSATPGPTPSPTASPSPSGGPSPTPTPTSTPTPTPPTESMSIVSARSRPIGTSVTVSGVVTAEGGRLGTPPLIAVADGSAGIVVRVPDGVALPPRGARVEVSGPLADPYGQLEIRPKTGGLRAVGSAALPAPATVTTLGEGTEGRLVVVAGIVEARPTKSSSGDITFYVRDAGGSIRLVADGSSGLTVELIVVGGQYEIVGIAGQRASRKGALDGYRVWVRDAGDLRLLAAPTPSPTSGPGATPTPKPGASGQPPANVRSIADAIRTGDGEVMVEGLVTIAPNLLDSTGRRIVIEDRTAGVEILLPTDAAPPAIGSRIRVEGKMGRAYDAPRIRADRLTTLAVGARPLPLALVAEPTAAHEWRLVRVSGTVVEVRKLGDRWRADLSIGGDRVAINGLAGAGIPSTALAEGRRATIVGIVRRPYPGAADRRWSVAPRSAADIVLAGGAPGSTGGDATDPPAGPGAITARPGFPAGTDVDIVDLAAHVGASVRVGGLVTELVSDGFLLDDGTAIGRVALAGEAAEYLPLIEPGDALNATGTIEADGEGFPDRRHGSGGPRPRRRSHAGSDRKRCSGHDRSCLARSSRRR